VVAPRTVARPAPGRATEAGYQIRPPTGAHAKGQRWSAQFARAEDTAQTYYELAFGDGRLQVMLTEPPEPDQGWATSPHARVVEALPPGGQQAGPVGWEAEDLRNSDSVQVAARILADADYQAAEIRRAAAEQSAALREAAEAEAAEIRQRAAPIREGAELEAAEIREQAAARAAAVRDAAEHEAAAIRTAAQREADALRSAIQTMSADLDRMAAYITENFTGPIERITANTGTRLAEGYPDGYARHAKGPAGTGPRSSAAAPAPVATPRADPAAPAPAVDPYEEPSHYDERPHYDEADSLEEASPGGRATSRAAPVITPARPATRPTRQTEKPGRSRQYRTMRVFTGTIAALVVIAIGTGAYQLATHGYTFFVFRSAGTGATDNNAIFPGIIPAPKPSPTHHQPPKGRHARGAHHHHPGGTHHHVKGH
jgi:hypothetical protein